MKNSKKLLFSVLALVVAMGAAITTTFAWFTTGNVATVDEIGMEMGTADSALVIGARTGIADTDPVKFDKALKVNDLLASKGLEMVNVGDNTYIATVAESAEGTYYKSAAANEKGVYTYTTTGDATTKYTITPFYLNAVTTTNVNAFTLEDGKPAAANKDYLSFEIFFKSDAKTNQNVYLGNKSSLIGGTTDNKSKDIIAWKAITTETYGQDVAKGSPISANAAWAMRVGFNYKENGTTAKTNVWNPYQNATLTFTDGANGTTNKSFYKNNLANDYYNTFFNKNNTVPEGVKNGSITPAAEGGTIFTADEAICNLYSQEIKTITNAQPINGELVTAIQGSVIVTIWAEGWDGDCFNSILGDAFNLSLSFVSNPVA